MREDRNYNDRVTRRSSTGARPDRPEREKRARIRLFEDTDDLYQTNASANDRDDRYDREDRHDDRYDRRDDRYDRRDDRYERDDRREDRRDRRDDRRDDRYERDDRRDDRYDRRDDRYDREDRRDRRDDRRDHRNGSDRRPDDRDDRRDRRDPAPKPRKQGGRRVRGGDTERFVHQIVPYVMFWIALFGAVSFVLRDLVGLGTETGAFGSWFADFLCGLFGPGAYVLPLFLVVLSLRWKKFVREGILAKKLLLSSAFVLLLSGIIHVFLEEKGMRGDLNTNSAELYADGMSRLGGGFFGGFAGEWLGYILRAIGTGLLAIPLLLVIGIYLVGLTPSGLWQRISMKFKQNAERRRAQNEAKYDGQEERHIRRPKTPAALPDEKTPALPGNGGKSAQKTYDFGEEEAPPARRYTRKELEEDYGDAAPPAGTRSIDIVDIPDDEPEIVRPAPAPTPAPAVNKHQEARQKLEELLQQMEEERQEKASAASAPAQPAPAPQPVKEPEERPLQGTYFAPFELPIRPEPKRQTAAQPAPASQMYTAEGSVKEEEIGKPVGTTTVPPLGTIYTPPAAPAAEKTTRMSAAEAFSAADRITASMFEEDVQPTPAPVPAAPAHTAAPAVAFERTRITDTEPAYPAAPAAEAKPAPAPAMDTVEDADDFSGIEEPAAPAAPAYTAPAPVPQPAPAPQPVAEEKPAVPVQEPPAPAPAPVRPTPVQRPTPAPKPEPKPAPEPPAPPKEYKYPPVALLAEDTTNKNVDHSAENAEKIELLRDTLNSFNVRIRDQIDCARGPAITRYEFRPEAGISVRQVTNRQDDIALALAAEVRIEAPVPGKPVIGIEVPNAKRETVFMRTMLETEQFQGSKKPLEVPIGMGIGGNIVTCDLASMPHLLVAGTTGSGKSVCINTILVSLMYKTSPKDLRLILIDPKQVEFAAFAHIPHLYLPIVTEMPRAVGALACAVQEMERRYSLMRDVGVRNIEEYNNATANDPEREHLPYMVIIIDEFADLKMGSATNDPENYTCRLAQKARAAGMHLIIGTQRPSVDIITGKLKNNIPSRIAFTVKQQVDSRTILDSNGAESLCGKGDMLYFPVSENKPARVQGAYVSTKEVEAVADYVRNHNDPVQYNREFMDQIEIEMARAANAGKKNVDDFDDIGDGDDDGEDPKFREAVELAIETQKVATSLLQRRLGVGYGRAAKIIDRMEAMGYVSAPEGNKARKVLITYQEFAAQMSGEGDFEEDEYDS